jgi:ferredoxin
MGDGRSSGGPAPGALAADRSSAAGAVGRDDIGRQAGPDAALIAVTVEAGGAVFSIAARIGDTLLAALKKAGFPLLSACGGRAACGTCRIGIAPAWGARLPRPGKVEGDLLACLPLRHADDRLACQIVLSVGLDGLEVRAYG